MKKNKWHVKYNKQADKSFGTKTDSSVGEFDFGKEHDKAKECHPELRTKCERRVVSDTVCLTYPYKQKGQTA